MSKVTAYLTLWCFGPALKRTNCPNRRPSTLSTNSSCLTCPSGLKKVVRTLLDSRADPQATDCMVETTVLWVSGTEDLRKTTVGFHCFNFLLYLVSLRRGGVGEE